MPGRVAASMAILCLTLVAAPTRADSPSVEELLQKIVDLTERVEALESRLSGEQQLRAMHNFDYTYTTGELKYRTRHTRPLPRPGYMAPFTRFRDSQTLRTVQ